MANFWGSWTDKNQEKYVFFVRVIIVAIFQAGREASLSEISILQLSPILEAKTNHGASCQQNVSDDWTISLVTLVSNCTEQQIHISFAKDIHIDRDLFWLYMPRTAGQARTWWILRSPLQMEKISSGLIEKQSQINNWGHWSGMKFLFFEWIGNTLFLPKRTQQTWEHFPNRKSASGIRDDVGPQTGPFLHNIYWPSKDSKSNIFATGN